MITPGETIAITTVANGFIVRSGSTKHVEDTLVFNDMGYSGNARDDAGVPHLLGFIERHFSAHVEALKEAAK